MQSNFPTPAGDVVLAAIVARTEDCWLAATRGEQDAEAEKMQRLNSPGGWSSSSA